MVTKIDTGNIMGIVRKIDDLNRIVLPSEVVREQDLRSRKVAIYPLRNGVYLEFDKEKMEV